MNGSEVLTQKTQAIGRHEFSDAQKFDLAVLGSDARCKTLFTLMEWVIEDARDEAMEADPADRNNQIALMTVAHSFDKFYKKVRSWMNVAATEHLADVRLKIAQKDLLDQAKIEEIILANQTSSS